MEVFENLQLRFGRNTRAGVGNGHANAVGSDGASSASFLASNGFAGKAPLPIAGLRGQPNRPLGGGELPRVVQQIRYNMLHFIEVKREALDGLRFEVIEHRKLR